MEAATAVPSSLIKSGFTNRSGGHLGYTVIDNGQEKAMSARPDEEIFLSAEEQILTANAPKQAKDNPFENGNFVLTTPSQQLANRRPIGDPSMLGGATPEADPEAQAAAEAKRAEEEARKAAEAERTAEAQKQAETGAQPRRSRPPAKSEGEGATEVAAPEETGTKAQPAGDAEGERAAAEEVATPEAEEV